MSKLKKNSKKDGKNAHFVRLRSFIGNNQFLFWLGIYVIIVVIIIPSALRITALKELAQRYLAPFGSLKPSYISFAGTSIGSFLAIFGAVWVQHRTGKKAALAATKKAALTAYHELKFAFDDLLPIYLKIWDIKSDSLKENRASAFLSSSNTTFLYLESDWLKNIANLSDVIELKEIKEIYSTYSSLIELKRIIDNKVTDTDPVYDAILNTEKFIYCEHHQQRGQPIVINGKTIDNKNITYVLGLLSHISKNGNTKDHNINPLLLL